MPPVKSLIPLTLSLLLLMLLSGCTFRTSGPEPTTVQFGTFRQETGEDIRVAMTESELQSQVMSFADRFASNVLQGYEDFDAMSPPIEQRRVILRSAVFSVASAYTIAAETDPDVALLDMVVMVTLGHLIYSEHWLAELGEPIVPMERGMRRARADVWQLAGRLLDSAQQAELLAMIEEWRRANPDKLTFSYVRFSDFADRRRSSMSRTGAARGIIRSVEMATRQVDEVRLLAERKMFLATRMPMLAGFFLDMTMSQLFGNPQVGELLDDLHRASISSENFVKVLEELPGTLISERQEFIEHAFSRLTAERQAAINHVMDRLADERQQTLEDFLAEEKRVKGLLTELRETLTVGSDLVNATNTLAVQLNLGENTEPFDINDYKKALEQTTAAITQLNLVVGETNQMLNSPGWENLFPKLEKTIDRVGAEGGEIIDHTFLRGVVLLLIWFVGYIAAKLILKRIPSKDDRKV